MIVLEQMPWIGANKNSAPMIGPMTADTNAARCATDRVSTRETYRRGRRTQTVAG